jgi:RND family efflux transporter MFP subunit
MNATMPMTVPPDRRETPRKPASASLRLPPIAAPRSSAGRRRYVLLALAVLCVVLMAAYFHGRPRENGAGRSLVLHTVARGDLPISVTERGNLESQVNTEIRCEVETVSNQSGTRIVYLVPNGSSIKKGDRLVEFDAAPLRERLDSLTISHEQSKAEQIQATVRWKNQQTQNETAQANAKLKVDLAELNLKMYEDGTEGTHQLALQELDLKIQEARNQIAEAQASLLIQKTERAGKELLYKLGYRGKGDVDQAVFKYLQAEDTLVRSTNALATAIANRKKLEMFQHPMNKMELEGSLHTARRGLLQVERDNESALAQVAASRSAADRALAKSEERLGRAREQLTKCKVLAPHDGMVAYSTERTPYGRIIAEGELVVERTKILTLPDLTHMQVRTQVHESVLDQVRVGMPTTVQVDAFSERSYAGTVRSVGVLPSQIGGFLSPDVKVYETIVTIDEAVEQLKPGMTAVVEIHVDCRKDVLSVPVQAVVQVQQDTWCYVEDADGVQRRTVKLGRSNDRFVEVLDGLEEGDTVVLNPMDVVEQAPISATDSDDPRAGRDASIRS